VRLAAKLTGWNIDIRSQSEVLRASKEAEEELLLVEGVGPKLFDELKKKNWDSAKKIALLTIEDLRTLPGVGEKKAEKILKSAKELMALKDKGPKQ
jgi:N utilization substance protein A